MRRFIVALLLPLMGCGYPISDSHDIVYSPTIITNSNIPTPQQNWSYSKGNSNRSLDQEPLYYHNFYR